MPGVVWSIFLVIILAVSGGVYVGIPQPLKSIPQSESTSQVVLWQQANFPTDGVKSAMSMKSVSCLLGISVATPEGCVSDECAFGRVSNVDLSTSSLLFANGSLAHIPSQCLNGQINPTTNGWVEDAHYSDCFFWCDDLSYFSGIWEVPSAPSVVDGQTIFLFIGEENSGESEIVQPVLQWGVSCDGGGDYWSIASWFVWGSGCAASQSTPLYGVNPGDRIEGIIQQDCCGEWTIFSEDVNTGFEFSITVSADTMVNAYVTLEAYGVDSCNEYPAAGGTHFWNLNVQGGGTPGWQNEFPHRDCSSDNVVASGSSSVWLYY